MPNEPVCIRRAVTVEEASIVVSWLQEHGIAAQVVDPSNPGVFAFGVTDPEGIEIYVADDDTARRAEAVLKEHDAEVTAHLAQHMHDPPIQITCSECGKTNSFAPSQAGSVQDCHHCGSYVDVPDRKHGGPS
jgi:hypothetical protein